MKNLTENKKCDNSMKSQESDKCLYIETLLPDLELYEYVIKPAMEFNGTPEDLGYKKIETPHGLLYLNYLTPISREVRL